MTNARDFAVKAHGNQKYGEAPYVVHLERVHLVLEQEGYAHDATLSNAAWLHDVAEDTEVTLDEIKQHFGEAVSDIVYRVTDEPGDDRKMRKLKTYPKIKGNLGATIVKLCDRIANVEASKTNPKKAEMYRAEYADFKENLFVPALADSLWLRLEKLINGLG